MSRSLIASSAIAALAMIGSTGNEVPLSFVSTQPVPESATVRTVQLHDADTGLAKMDEIIATSTPTPTTGVRYTFPDTNRSGTWQCLQINPARFQKVSADLSRLVPGKTFTADADALAKIVAA